MDTQPINNTPGSENAQAASSNFTIKKENINYNISIKCKKNTIDFSVRIALCPFTFEGNFTYDDFLSVNKVLMIYDNLNDIYDMILSMFIEQEVTISDEDDKFLIKFELEANKIKKEISLTLKKNSETNTDAIINDMSKVIQLLADKIEKMEENNNLKDNVIKNMSEEMDKLKEENNNLKSNVIRNMSEKIEKLEKENKTIRKKVELMLHNQSLILTETEIDLVKKWIDATNYQKLKFTLLFRSSIHGKSREEFHETCDNKGKTLVLVKTTDGYRIGGYTALQWESPQRSNYKGNDPSAFVFSLNDSKKYTCHHQSYVIHCHSSYGFWFGNADLYTFDFNTVINDYRSYGYKEGVTAAGYLIGGNNTKYSTSMSECEVYLVEGL